MNLENRIKTCRESLSLILSQISHITLELDQIVLDKNKQKFGYSEEYPYNDFQAWALNRYYYLKLIKNNDEEDFDIMMQYRKYGDIEEDLKLLVDQK